VKGYVENGRFVADAMLFSMGGYGSVRLEKNVLHKNIPTWDRCFNASTLEIVDDQLTPVFQMVYTTPNDIVISGVFHVDQIVYILSDGLSWHAAEEPVTSDEYSVKLIFKYPSREYFCKQLEPISRKLKPTTKPPPYRGLPNGPLCDEVSATASTIYAKADRCFQELVDASTRKEPADSLKRIRRSFSDDFEKCCSQKIIDLHEELIFRLKPQIAGEGERFFREMLRESRNASGVPFSTVEEISTNLRNLCGQLTKGKLKTEKDRVGGQHLPN
jgi:hypothetical protein